MAPRGGFPCWVSERRLRIGKRRTIPFANVAFEHLYDEVAEDGKLWLASTAGGDHPQTHCSELGSFRDCCVCSLL